jgi:DNA-binding MarR family transcriptional regulator
VLTLSALSTDETLTLWSSLGAVRSLLVLPTTADSAFRFGGHLAADSDGRLFDRRTRERLRSVHESESEAVIGVVEALQALLVTARAVRYSGERWARGFGLSEVRLQLLLMVRHHPNQELTLGQLAMALDLSPRTVTSLVDLLERDRLVSRKPHPHDRRATLVRMTQAGRDKVDQVWDELWSRHLPLLAGFTAEEMADLRHLCYRLLYNLAAGD